MLFAAGVPPGALFLHGIASVDARDQRLPQATRLAGLQTLALTSHNHIIQPVHTKKSDLLP